MVWASGVRGYLPQAADVARRRGAEQAAVFAAELRRAFVTDLKCRRCRIHVFQQHQTPGR